MARWLVDPHHRVGGLVRESGLGDDRRNHGTAPGGDDDLVRGDLYLAVRNLDAKLSGTGEYGMAGVDRDEIAFYPACATGTLNAVGTVEDSVAQCCPVHRP